MEHSTILNGGIMTVLPETVFSGNGGQMFAGYTSHGWVFNWGGSSSFSHVVFSGGSSRYGGAIDNYNELGAPMTSIIELNNVIFESNTGDYGGAIDNYYGSVSLTSGSFTSNYGNLWGGAVYNEGGSVSLLHANFTGNSTRPSAKGGAILNGSNGVVRVASTRFERNSSGDGGAIYNFFGTGITASVTMTVSDTDFISNSARVGGAVDNFHAGMELRQVNLSGNSADNGGGIYNNNGTMNLMNVQFSANKATQAGGALHNCENGSVQAVSAGFSGNSGNWGGGVYNTSGTISFFSADFTSNTAQTGGGIQNEFSGAVAVADGVFVGNSAVYGGGALFNSGSVSLTGAEFRENRAATGGGIQNQQMGTMNLAGTVLFSGNSASFGGALFNSGTIHARNAVMFSGNAGQNSGGAVCNYGDLHLSGGAVFSGNTAGYAGGAVYNGGRMILNDVRFSGNRLQFAGGIGAGVVNDNGGSMTIVSGSFTGHQAQWAAALFNQSAELRLSGVEFASNTADDWGGAINNRYGTVYADRVTFSDHSAQWGGAVFNEWGNMTLTEAEFTGNSGAFGGYGGAMVNSSGTVILENVSFRNNSAGYGGALYNSGSVVEGVGRITGTGLIFSGNTGLVNGGVATNADALIEFRSVEFRENRASGYGGVFWNEHGSVITISDAVFSSNSAGKNGGVFLNTTYSVVNLHDVEFSGNSARYGGAVWNEGGSSVFARNITLRTSSDSIVNASASHLVFSGENIINASVLNDGNVIFDLFASKRNGAYIVSDWKQFSGSGNYALNLPDFLFNGSYRLAGNAAGFNRTFTVTSGGLTYGSLSAGGSITISGVTYALNVENSRDLTLNVSGGRNASPNTDLLSNGCSQIVAWCPERGAVGYVAVNGEEAPPWRGVWEWPEEESGMWKVAATGRFSETVSHDGILLYNGTNNTFAAWTDLGSGDYSYLSLGFVDGSFNTKTLLNLDGNSLDDVLIYDDYGSFGVMLDGREWKSICDRDGAATWRLIGAGDFGGEYSNILASRSDGVTNAYYLWNNNDPSFAVWDWSTRYIGSLETDWKVGAVGDFQGDGVDDIIMWQQSTGNVFAWENGQSSSQRWVGNLDSSQWEIAAVGDYNGDGRDDLLLRELVSGWGAVGYWGAANASNWTDLNSRVEAGFENYFSIIA